MHRVRLLLLREDRALVRRARRVLVQRDADVGVAPPLYRDHCAGCRTASLTCRASTKARVAARITASRNMPAQPCCRPAR